MNCKDKIQRILTEYRKRLGKILGDDLNSVILYGSQARGDALEHSDIDVLCVMNGPFDYGLITANLSFTHRHL